MQYADDDGVQCIPFSGSPVAWIPFSTCFVDDALSKYAILGSVLPKATHLEIKGASLGDVGMASICKEMAKMVALARLVLEDIGMTDKSAIQLATTLSLSTMLEKVNLRNNFITLAGATVLVHSFGWRQHQLRQVNVECSLLDRRGQT
ncbi:Aste57867_12171 [Aphanomyces stellatus]|uniref:Aste57867_12171 protein n=1 Tax=Aphanomyces stellatus TaxID=120398 RepID=A0A485KVN0_9STRA|nr:hypothetical protein As57867_012126 [Aphanomyces stellatus]VFT89025.1 Aste57867_12171 [Aphanomyces stellatus]